MWQYIAVWVATLVISSYLRPKPEQPRAAGLSDIEVPTAEEGREIGVLFGTEDIKSPNCYWYGDLKAKAVKKSGGKK